MLEAAVVVPIVRYPEPALVLVRRAAHLRRNPGEIAFPGGVVDPADGSPLVTALREFEEELGLSRERVRIVARLADVVTLSLGVNVAPFVGVIEPPAPFAHDAGETESVHEVPLAALYAAGALHEGLERIERGGTRYDVPSWLFDYDGLHVWGATARMLRGFVERFPDLASVPLELEG
jgi:8-oxo-dGTP pyrophosphatase MutT (NUDIX family)